MGLKRLLAATDFSARADRAVKRAVQIASERGAALTLFHVCGADVRDDVPTQQLAVNAEKRLRQQIRALSLPDRPLRPSES
jgi:nucleotide-binding universal stress UspA family protein